MDEENGALLCDENEWLKLLLELGVTLVVFRSFDGGGAADVGASPVRSITSRVLAHGSVRFLLPFGGILQFAQNRDGFFNQQNSMLGIEFGCVKGDVVAPKRRVEVNNGNSGAFSGDQRICISITIEVQSYIGNLRGHCIVFDIFPSFRKLVISNGAGRPESALYL
jgi:hypothetical protein